MRDQEPLQLEAVCDRGTWWIQVAWRGFKITPVFVFLQIRKGMHAHIHTHIYQYVLDTNSGGCDDIRVRPHLFDGSTHCMWTPV